MPALSLPERCDRAAVAALLPDFIAAQGDAPVEVDANAVKQVGIALLQLLVSARRSGGGAVISPSPALLDAAQITGLSAELFEENVK